MVDNVKIKIDCSNIELHTKTSLNGHEYGKDNFFIMQKQI
jgi:hypothetical protein